MVSMELTLKRKWLQWFEKLKIVGLILKLTLLGSCANKSFAKDVNSKAALIAPAPVPPTPSVIGLVTPL